MNSKLLLVLCLFFGWNTVSHARTFSQAQRWHQRYDKNKAEFRFEHLLNGTTSGETLLGGYYHKFEDHWVGLRYSNETHIYEDNTKLSDSFWELTHSTTLGKKSYIENRLGASFDATFSPKFLVESVPHLTFGNHDLALGLRFSEYDQGVHTWTLLPAYGYFFPRGGVGANFYGVWVDGDSLWAGALWFKWIWTARFSTKVWFSSGETVEGPRVYKNFNSEAVEGIYALTPSVNLKGGLSYYDSSIRREFKLNLGVEWTF